MRTTAAAPAEVLALTRGAAGAVAAAACQGEYVVKSDATRTTHTLTFVDLLTAVDKDIELPWRSALVIRTLRTRPRPCGHFLDGSQQEAAARLRNPGVTAIPPTSLQVWDER